MKRMHRDPPKGPEAYHPFYLALGHSVSDHS